MNWLTVQRKVSDLIPAPINPRQLSEKQFADLKKSLEKFGLAEIPAINTDNQILAGHMRLKVMSALGRGDEIIDVRIPERALTRAEADEYLIRSNKNTGSWDMDALSSFEVEELRGWGFDDFDLGLSSFEPNVNPTFNADDVTKEEVEKRAKELAAQMVSEQNVVDVTCPSCGHDFTLEK